MGTLNSHPKNKTKPVCTDRCAFLANNNILNFFSIVPTMTLRDSSPESYHIYSPDYNRHDRQVITRL